jgi:hypothetical protein
MWSVQVNELIVKIAKLEQRRRQERPIVPVVWPVRTTKPWGQRGVCPVFLANFKIWKLKPNAMSVTSDNFQTKQH